MATVIALRWFAFLFVGFPAYVFVRVATNDPDAAAAAGRRFGSVSGAFAVLFVIGAIVMFAQGIADAAGVR